MDKSTNCLSFVNRFFFSNINWPLGSKSSFNDEKITFWGLKSIFRD